MTKFKIIDIHKDGYHTAAIVKMIGKHNGGKVPFQIPDFLSFPSHEKALDPFCKDLIIIRDEGDDNKFYVSEDGGKTFTLTIEEIEIHELQDVL